MATEAQARVSFTTDIAELQKVPKTPFSVPVNVNASGLSEVISHLLGLKKAQFFSFLVVDDGQLLQSSIENYLIENHKSSEHIIHLKFFPATKGPEPAASIPCPDWISGISTALPNFVIAACYNGSAEVRDATGEETVTVCKGHSGPVKAVSAAATAQGFRMVTASKDHKVVLWEAQHNQSTEKLSVSQVAVGFHNKSVDTIVMGSSDTFFSGSWDGTVKYWAWPGARAAADEPAPAKRARKPSDGGDAAAPSDGSSIIAPVATLTGHTNQVSCLTVLNRKAAAAAAAAAAATTGDTTSASANRFVVSGSWDHSLRIWDVDRFVSLRAINCGKVVNSVVGVSAAENVFASAHPDNAIRIWDGRVDGSGSALRLALRGHEAWVSALSTSPVNDNEIASVRCALVFCACSVPRLCVRRLHAHSTCCAEMQVSFDGSLRIWDIRSNKPVHSLTEAHDGRAFAVSWDAAAGRGIFTGGDDNKLNHFNV